MVLRDSKQDKVTMDSPVNSQANISNISSSKHEPGINAAEVHSKSDMITIDDRDVASSELVIPSLEVSSPTSRSLDRMSTQETNGDTSIFIIGDNLEAFKTEDPHSVKKQKYSLEEDGPSASERKVSSLSGYSESPSTFSRSHSREVSPMQEKLQQEQKWKKNLVKMDEVLSDISAPHKGQFTQQLFLQTFRNKTTLRLLFKLYDWDSKGRITQEKLVDSARRVLQGHGGREWVELLEVIAYVVCEEEEGDVAEDHFVKIFQSKGLVEKLFKYITRDGDGYVSRQYIMDLIANLTYARPRQGFNQENLQWLENLFRQTLGTKQELSFEDFKKIVHSQNSFFAERVFEIFDRDKSGSVSLSEFLDAMHEFAGKSPYDKIKFLFRVYDLDGDGLIQREELEQVMKACMEENGMKFSHEQIEDLTLALFEDADTEQRGEITYEALKAQLERHPGLLENLSISIDRWLVPPQPQSKKESHFEKLAKMRPYQLTLPYLRNNYIYLLFLLFYVAVNLGLFIDRALLIYSQGHNEFYIFARASGQCLNFNCSFILVLMLRQCITFLRSHGFALFLPLDQHLYFHKLTGVVVFFFSSLHTLMHLINFPLNIVPSPVYNPNHLTAEQWLFTSAPGAFGLVKGWANPTGFILMIILIIMVICSLPFVRKSGYFEVFYWTHLLYIAFWILTILHAPNFWKWFVGPAVLFIIERIYRACRVKTGHGKTYISSGILLPSKVIHLVIKKPITFHYRPGDYVYVNIPAIAHYEWHPFTISSAPEQDGVVWLHIRAVGEWTNRLYSYFEEQQLQCERNFVKKLSCSFDTKMPVEIDSFDLHQGSEEDGEGDAFEIEMDKGRKNGVVNVAYETETEKAEVAYDSKTEESRVERQNRRCSAPAVPRRLLRGKKLEKTTSVPDFDVRIKKRQRNFLFRENYRNNSEANINPGVLGKEITFADANAASPSDFMFPTNRSVVQSVRYMRRKPRVVTLDFPDESDNEYSPEETEANEDSESDRNKEDPEAEIPKPTAVRRASGRIFDRFHSRRGTKSQRKKSFEESQLRRISRLREAETFGQCTVGTPLVIYIDGPYGTPSSHIFRAQHAVLVATGIGVTPFASILQSIMQRYLKARQSCPKCAHHWTSDIPESVMNLRKVDFFWINRNQRSFEWFVNLLSQLEIEQAEQGGVLERFLDMHMFITSALQRTDMKAVGLQLALELLHEKEKRDLITGLKTRTNAGRPNWDKVFKQLSSQKKGKITVFFCGPPALGRILRFKCDEYGFYFRKEVF